MDWNVSWLTFGWHVHVSRMGCRVSELCFDVEWYVFVMKFVRERVYVNVCVYLSCICMIGERVYLHVFIHGCGVFPYSYVHDRVYLHFWICTCECLCACAYIYICTHMYVYGYVRVCVSQCVCACLYPHTFRLVPNIHVTFPRHVFMSRHVLLSC